jgi:hypothetical protein
MENGIKIGQGIKAGVIAEGAFHAEFVEIDVAFQNNF